MRTVRRYSSFNSFIHSFGQVVLAHLLLRDLVRRIVVDEERHDGRGQGGPAWLFSEQLNVTSFGGPMGGRVRGRTDVGDAPWWLVGRAAGRVERGDARVLVHLSLIHI